MSNRYHSNRGPITKEDSRVQGSGKVHSWKTCRKPMGAVAKKVNLEYKRKRDNKEVHGFAGVYTLVCFTTGSCQPPLIAYLAHILHILWCSWKDIFVFFLSNIRVYAYEQ